MECSDLNPPDGESADVVGPPWLDVLGNVLIFRKLETMISYADLKALRLVSSRLNEIVLDKSNFVSRTTFNLTKQAIRDQVLANVGFPVENVTVPLFYAASEGGEAEMHICKDAAEEVEAESAEVLETWRHEDVEHIYEKLSGVQKLTIRDQHLVKTSSGPKIVYPDAKRILQSPIRLKKLKLDWKGYVPESILKAFDELVHECLTDLTELEILPLGRTDERSCEHHKDDEIRRSNEYVASLIASMQNNRYTLESIKVHESGVWEAQKDLNTRISDIQFPKLEEVGVRFEATHAEEVLNFLKRHSDQLTSLSVRCVGALERPFMDFFEKIGRQLKVLRIELKTFADPVGNQFSFLRDCTHLEEFTLYFIPSSAVEPNGDSLQIVFENIPSCVRKLRLGSIPNPNGGTIGLEKLATFSNLKSLELVSYWTEWFAVDHSTLKVIFGKLTSLQELKLIGLNCNDEGFAGRKADGTKDDAPSISDLKGLVKLTIHHSEITGKGVVQACKFPNLQFLDICHNNNVNDVAWEDLLSQNPAMEVVKMCFCSSCLAFPTAKKLKEEFPRFKKFQNACEEQVVDFEDADNSYDEGSESDESGEGSESEQDQEHVAPDAEPVGADADHVNGVVVEPEGMIID